jgi:cytidine deaminase
MTNEELIEKAASVINIKRNKGDLIGDVGCALISGKDNLYLGICAAVGSNTFCAEQIAVCAMITAGEYNVKKIVAIWKNEKGEIFVLSPCGNCRQFIYQINEKNLDTDIILDKRKVVKLKELLPYENWFQLIK